MLKTAVAKRQNVLEPPGRWPALKLNELWDYRDLLYLLAWRDMRVRYTQAVLGGAWAVLQPLLLMGIFTLVFSRIANVPTQGVPYPLFALAALVPWTLFSNAVGTAANSVVGNANLVSKVNTPGLLIPAGAVLTWVPDFAVGSALLFVMMGLYGMVPMWTSVLLPLVLMATILSAMSIGIWFSALNVAYRDVRYIVPLVIQALLFLTPIAYPSTSIPDAYRWIAGLNPMTWVIDFARWTLLGTSMSKGVVVSSLALTLVLLASGVYYFRRVEHFFADVI